MNSPEATSWSVGPSVLPSGEQGVSIWTQHSGSVQVVVCSPTEGRAMAKMLLLAADNAEYENGCE